MENEPMALRFRKIAALLMLATAMLLLPAGESLAQSKKQIAKGSQPPRALKEHYTWVDTDGEHTVWLDPEYLAEFRPGPAGASAIQTLDVKAKIAGRPASNVRVWKVSDGDSAEVKLLAEKARAVAPEGTFSPLFRRSPDGTGALMALPGGVIVRFNPAWNEEQVRRWFAEHMLIPERRVPVKGQTWVVPSAAGLPALELAERLHSEAGVIAAYPDWWIERRRR